MHQVVSLYVCVCVLSLEVCGPAGFTEVETGDECPAPKFLMAGAHARLGGELGPLQVR